MIVFKTIALAFSLFSAIPVPRVEWNSRNLRYVMCAFPLVGVIIGGVCWLWLWGCLQLRTVSVQQIYFLQAAGLTLLPVLLSGGIHLDGLCDTADALGSHSDRAKMASILRDPHCGASALIACCGWFAGMFAFSASIHPSVRTGAALVLLFTLSRLLSAFAVASLPPAEGSSLVKTFSDTAQKRIVRISTGGTALCLSLVVSLFAPWECLSVVVAQSLFSIYYVRLCRRFGGISGDLAGWFVQWAEFVSMGALAIVPAVLAYIFGVSL